MRVLLTNDDGIEAEGLENLYSLVSKYEFVTELWVVAPDINRSCCSHSMSYNQSIKAIKQEERRFAVTGTPVDCVIIALKDLMKECKPDFVISGINAGANLDVDVTYSGTVSAAREAALIGIPAIAISQLYRNHKDSRNIKWQHEDKEFTKLLANLMSSYQDKSLFQDRSLLNINLPSSKIRGVKCLPQGNHYLGNHIESINAEKDSKEYVIGTNKITIDSPSLYEGYIVITPLGVDLTNHEVLAYLAKK